MAREGYEDTLQRVCSPQLLLSASADVVNIDRSEVRGSRCVFMLQAVGARRAFRGCGEESTGTKVVSQCAISICVVEGFPFVFVMSAFSSPLRMKVFSRLGFLCETEVGSKLIRCGIEVNSK